MINLYLTLVTDCTLFVQIFLYFVFRYVFENEKDMVASCMFWFDFGRRSSLQYQESSQVVSGIVH